MALIAGILLIFISIAHFIFGERKQIPDLKKITNDSIVVGSHRIMIFQGGMLLLAVGVLQVLIAINVFSLEGIARYFPVAIVLTNFLTAFCIIIISHRAILKITIPQFFIFIVIILLQFFSIR
jgi:hypothetical protein